MIDALRAYLAPRIDADTHRRLVAQKSAVIHWPKPETQQVYFVQCHECGWHADELAMWEEANERRGRHLDDSPVCLGQVEMSFEIRGRIPIDWK